MYVYNDRLGMCHYCSATENVIVVAERKESFTALYICERCIKKLNNFCDNSRKFKGKVSPAIFFGYENGVNI